jgi:hypothetical protein
MCSLLFLVLVAILWEVYFCRPSLSPPHHSATLSRDKRATNKVILFFIAAAKATATTPIILKEMAAAAKGDGNDTKYFEGDGSDGEGDGNNSNYFEGDGSGSEGDGNNTNNSSSSNKYSHTVFPGTTARQFSIDISTNIYPSSRTAFVADSCSRRDAIYTTSDIYDDNDKSGPYKD